MGAAKTLARLYGCAGPSAAAGEDPGFLGLICIMVLEVPFADFISFF